MALFKWFMKDMGIDLGTANTLVNMKGKGIVVREPSVVAVDQRGSVLAVGIKAKDMIGRTPGNIRAIRPLRDGVIADFEITEKMIAHFIKTAYPNRSIFFSPRVVIGVPSDCTEVEKRAVLEAAFSAGAKDALLIEEPMAAAIGAGLEVAEPNGSMIVDIGGGTTEIAVISLGGIVTSRSIRIGGDTFDDAIMNYIKKEYSVMIGERTAERIKVEIGSVYAVEERFLKVNGRNLVNGLPRELNISSKEVQKALEEPVATIIEGIKFTLEKTPPELSADIMVKGIVLTGGGALLENFAELIHRETHMPVHIAEDPLDCVAKGTGMALENYDLLKSVFISPKNVY